MRLNSVQKAMRPAGVVHYLIAGITRPG